MILLAAVLALAIVPPTYTAKTSVGKSTVRVTVSTKKKLRADQKLRVYFAPPTCLGVPAWGPPARDVRPRPRRPSSVLLHGEKWCPGRGYVSVDLLRDGLPSRNVVTRQVRIF